MIIDNKVRTLITRQRQRKSQYRSSLLVLLSQQWKRQEKQSDDQILETFR